MKKIVVIEDELTLLKELSQLLEFEGYENVLSAPDGVEGIEQIRTAKPDLILCDIGLPNLDGYDVLRWVRSEADLKNVPFIFLTAFRYEYNRKVAEELGCDAYLMKPFDIDDLLSTIKTFLNPSPV